MHQRVTVIRRQVARVCSRPGVTGRICSLVLVLQAEGMAELRRMGIRTVVNLRILHADESLIAGVDGLVVMTGDDSLRSRPMRRLPSHPRS